MDVNQFKSLDDAILNAVSAGPVKHRMLTVGPVRKACEDVRDALPDEKTYLQILDGRLRMLSRAGYIKHIGGGWVLGDRPKVDGKGGMKTLDRELDPQRDAFEAAIKAERDPAHLPVLLEQNSLGAYLNDWTRAAWWGWQQATAKGPASSTGNR